MGNLSSSTKTVVGVLTHYNGDKRGTFVSDVLWLQYSGEFDTVRPMLNSAGWSEEQMVVSTDVTVISMVLYLNERADTHV
jgi:hypothetical protein